ncbi:uncharacterized protein LOC100692144 isoform X5 [Oreochromis niloticus]|uniref:uncharacterized protein LOC100692144 isoform X5 n=1 Tax=Oreochromis niloticus TaxID=8128 RepID=UPI000DF1EBD7|nr:uncharacterized protein LOC100692144 isoform X5 [Oreochromis niloticus]
MMDTANSVTKLNEYANTRKFEVRYEEIRSDGPPHDKVFYLSAVIDGKAYPSGEGKTKKEAKQNAAKNALESLSQLGHQDSVESRNTAAEASVQMILSSKDTSFTETNFIGLINDYCQRTKRSDSYVKVKKDGPSHIPLFFYKLIIDNKEYPVGDGKSIMEAKQRAAELACSALQEQPDWDSKVSVRPTALEDGAPPDSLASSVTQESIESSSQGLTTDKSESVIFEESSNPPTDQRNNAAEASVQMVPSSKDTSFTETDFKSLVNRYCQKTKRSHSYVEVKKDGPSHIPHFFYKLIIDNKEYPVGDGKSAMEAKQRAAELAWSALQEQPDWDSMVSIRPTASEDGAPPESLASSVTQESIESSSQGLTTDKSESVIFDESSNPPTDQRNNAAEASVQMVPSSKDTSFTETDFKSLVNRYCQKTRRSHSYVEVKKDGPSHIPHFFYKLIIDNKEYPVGDGKSIMEAKQRAAELAWSALQEQPDWDSMVSIRPTASEDGAPPESLASSVTQESIESSSQGLTTDKSESVIFEESSNPSTDQRNNAAEASVQMVPSSKDTSFTETDFKSLVNRYCQKTRRSHSYVEVKKDGPSHIPHFFYKLIIDNKEYPVGDGKSIMEAKQRAAELAWSALQEQPDWDSMVSIRPTASEDGAPPESLASSVTQESIESSSQGLTTDKSESVIFEESSNPPTDQRNNAAEASVQMVPSSKDTSFTETDFKSLVNRYCQKTKRSHSYVEVKKDGPSHIPHFFYKLIIDNKEYPVGDGKSIMEAKQRAAELAWSALQEQPDWDSMVSIRPTALEDGAPPESLASSVTQESIESSSQGLTTDKSESVIFEESSNPSTDQRNNAAEASVQMVPSSEDTSCTETDFKSLVNRYCQKTKRSHSYVEVKKDGPSHIPHFFYKLIIDNKEYPVGDGNSIKIAQQKAAELACSALQEQPDWDSMVSIRPTASEDGAPPESLASSVTQESIESSSQGLTTDKSESVIFEESSNPPTDQRNTAAEASVQMVPSSEDTSCTETDFKSLVNRYCQKTKRSHSYVEVKKDGPSHIPQFFYKLKIDNKEYPVGDGKTVKIAQQKAAELACSVLQEQPDWDSMVSIRPTASEDGAPPESLASSVTQ